MIFKHPQRHFFRIKGVFTTRSIAVMGVMTAVSAILEALTRVDVSAQFTIISFAFIPASVVSLLYGPWAGMAFGAVSDLVNFIVHPQGFYFPGYALSAMLGNVMYAFFLYKRPVSVWRVTAARILVTLAVTFGLNFFWDSVMYGMAPGAFFGTARLISNAIKLPLQVLLIFLTGNLAVRIDKRYPAR